MIYPIAPVAKPRMTRRDKWNPSKSAQKYFAFKDECRLNKVSFENGQSITFIIPMPRSWSKKKRAEMNYEPHRQTPDVDNLIKALFDAIFDDDSHIWNIGHAQKVWGHAGEILIY